MMHRQLHVWLPAPEFANRIRNHAMPRERHGNSDAKRTGFAKGYPFGAPLRLIDVLQDATRIAQEQRARRAQSDSAGQPVEQEKSQLFLQVLNLPRQWRLRDMEARSCSPEMLLLANRDEIAQMP
jgi:hypothetical protein